MFVCPLPNTQESRYCAIFVKRQYLRYVQYLDSGVQLVGLLFTHEFVAKYTFRSDIIFHIVWTIVCHLYFILWPEELPSEILFITISENLQASYFSRCQLVLNNT